MSEKKGYIFFVFVKAENGDEAINNFWQEVKKEGYTNTFDIRTILEVGEAKKIMENSKKWEKLMKLLK